MSSKKNITVKEHFIPQVYLRGFSPQYKKYSSKDKETKYMIYRYNTLNEAQSEEIPIESICYKKNLYEIYGKDGNPKLQNRLEDVFGKFEAKFGEFRTRLEKKAFCESNYRISCFLSKEEKVFWTTYIVLQLLRLPVILEEAEKACKELFLDKINSNDARTLARWYCLPLFQEVDMESDEFYVFRRMFEPMADMAFTIYIDKEGRFITSDSVVYVQTVEYPCEEYNQVIFPISAQLCLVLWGKEDKAEIPVNYRNILRPADEEVRKMVLRCLTNKVESFVYSNHKFSKKELEYLKEVDI